MQYAFLAADRGGLLRVLAPLVIFSEALQAITRHPPRHGEHAAEVLAEFGIDLDAAHG